MNDRMQRERYCMKKNNLFVKCVLVLSVIAAGVLLYNDLRPFSVSDWYDQNREELSLLIRNGDKAGFRRFCEGQRSVSWHSIQDECWVVRFKESKPETYESLFLSAVPWSKERICFCISENAWKVMLTSRGQYRVEVGGAGDRGHREWRILDHCCIWEEMYQPT